MKRSALNHKLSGQWCINSDPLTIIILLSSLSVYPSHTQPHFVVAFVHMFSHVFISIDKILCFVFTCFMKVLF